MSRQQTEEVNQRHPVFGLREVSCLETVRIGIFNSGANLNAPIVLGLDEDIYPRPISIENLREDEPFAQGIERGYTTRSDELSGNTEFPPHTEFQCLEDCMKGGKNQGQMMRHLTSWGTYIGVGGVGLFSLLNRTPAFTLARLDIEFRAPTPEETSYDQQRFREQVVGEEIRGRDVETNVEPRVILFGRPHFYRGPPRVSKFMFNTIVRPGDVPRSLDAHIQEINERMPLVQGAGTQCFQFYYADNGELKYGVFVRPESFSVESLREYGVLKLEDSGRKLTFYPGDQPGTGIDYTDLLEKPQ